VIIAVLPVDLEPKLEVFRLTVRRAGDLPPSRSAHVARFFDSDEALSAFIGISHRVLVGARKHSTGPSSDGGYAVVEDVLVLRHHSGQQAFVCADDEQLGALLVVRNRENLSFPEATFEYLRAL
jgi:hypothetical protein